MSKNVDTGGRESERKREIMRRQSQVQREKRAAESSRKQEEHEGRTAGERA